METLTLLLFAAGFVLMAASLLIAWTKAPSHATPALPPKKKTPRKPRR